MDQDQARLDTLCVNTIRMLAVDMIEAARSGHPGMPLGAAGMAYVLWSRFLRVNPQDPAWPNRDRFILSAGHASALLYALLHLSGFDLPLSELKRFRQWGSKTAGHPEYGLCPGVEATTGPLGHGFAMGVGMALAERWLAHQFNRPGLAVMDHYTYALVSDGDLMEGVSAEAASLAGTLGLGKLIYLYDDNRITIEGSTDLTFSEDVAGRFRAYGWQVLEVPDGQDLAAVEAAIRLARADTTRPSLIKVRTEIGYDSPKQGSPDCHGAPLGPEAAAAVKKTCGWPDEPWHIPEEARRHMEEQVADRGRQAQEKWQAVWAEYTRAHPEPAAAFEEQFKGRLPRDWQAALPAFQPGDGPIATRAASGKVLNSLAEVVPHLLGGSADLAPSNKTLIAGSGDMRCLEGRCGRNIHFGVREHAMGAVVNGMALHGGVIPYAGTFFVFSDFMRPALRMAALMQTRNIFVFTHDSVAVGEDGPTHQPIEQLMSLRLMPGLTLIRPADANETAAAWRLALTLEGPVALVLSRQKLPVLDHADYPGLAEGVARGAYVLSDCQGAPALIILASGAEVHLALAAQKELTGQGIACRVVSMPSWELFQQQDQDYRDQVLPPAVTARLAVEAGASLGWERWVGPKGDVIGIDRFGASAPGGEVLQRLGFNLDEVMARARALL